MKAKEINAIVKKLPQYLDILRTTEKTYGTLRKEGEYWIIEAEPQVMELVKRLFHATSDNKSGEAWFGITNRTNADLNWLMMRFPLQIKNFEDWNKSIQGTRKHIAQRLIIQRKKSVLKPGQEFIGSLLRFQKEGLAFMYHNKRCLLADEMGLGKTVEALGLISKYKRFPILVVCPPHLMSQWESETKRFLGDNTRIHLLQGLHPYQLPNADMYIVHYLIIRGWYEKLMEMGFDMVILDEVQELRHNGSKKYNGTKQMVEFLDPEYVIGLSGTPIYNYGAEMYNIMDVIDTGCLGARRYFMKEWCQWGYMIRQPKVFGRYLTEEGLLLRRRKEEVMSELPEKRIAIQDIDVNKDLFIELSTQGVEMAQKIPLVKDKEKGMLMLSAVANVRRATGIAKSQHVAEFVKVLLQSKEPCLVFAYHHSVMELLAKYLEPFKPLFVTGRQTRAEKRKNVKAFMGGETDLLILNLRTTAGLNLQRARCVVFAELDWSPAVHTQAEDRVHRIGQKDSVLVYYLRSPTMSDMEISECLQLKQRQFSGIMRDRVRSEKEKVFGQVAAQKFMWNMVEGLIEKQDEEIYDGMP